MAWLASCSFVANSRKRASIIKSIKPIDLPIENFEGEKLKPLLET